MNFTGERIELLAAGPLDGKVKVTIDGKTPQDLDGCWQTSRVSRLPNVPDWPAIKQVSVAPSVHEADTWTVRVSHLSPAQDKFDFTLTSAKHGADGSGRADEPFTSRSGRVAIQPGDWTLAYAFDAAHSKGVPEGASFQWERKFVCTDQPALALPNGAVEQRHVLATGLANGPHRVAIALAPEAPAVSEIRAYEPPLVN